MKTTTLVCVCHVFLYGILLFMLFHYSETFLENHHLFQYRDSPLIMEIPEALRPLLTSETSEGARRLYGHGVRMFMDGERRENGGKLMIAAIGDAPALYFRVLESATKTLEQKQLGLCAQLLGVARDGLLKAVEAECERLGQKANTAVGGRHVLELTVNSGARYTESMGQAQALNHAAALYLGELEELIRKARQNATTTK